MLGKIKAAASQGGLGWFQEVITLQAPYVHEDPDSSWFNTPILDKCKESIADPNSITVMLTGRLRVYEDRIKHILSRQDLKFDHYGLKPGMHIFTLEYKLNFINELLEKYKGQLVKVNIYEDRMEHAFKFERFIRCKNVNCEVILVKPGVTIMSREQELELVRKLIEKNLPQLKIVEHPTYTGVILDADSRARLLSCIPPPLDWVVTAHHMTMALGVDQVSHLGGDFKIGDKAEMLVTAVGFDRRSLAVKIDNIPSTNSIPHVTIAHSSLGKPSDSNMIKEWVPIGEVIQNGFVEQPMFSFKAETKVEVANAVAVANSELGDTRITAVTIVNQEQKVRTERPLQPPQTIRTAIPPEGLRLTGQILVQTIFDIALNNYSRASGPSGPSVRTRYPKGTSIGDTIKKFHPQVESNAVGQLVKQVRAWTLTNAKEGKVDVTAEELDEFVKNLSI